MKVKKRTGHLGLLFILAVLLPGLFLAALAIRSIDREEAYLEIRLRQTLEAELGYTITLLQTELADIEEELRRSAPAAPGSDPGAVFATWGKSERLIQVPFLLSSDFRILWPTPTDYASSDDLAFLNWNRDFITDRTAIPYYQNIALLFRDQITESEAGKSRFPSFDSEEAAARPKAADIQVQQRALSEFEKSEPLRKKVYDTAKELGQRTEQRTVSPGAGKVSSEETSDERRESLFISEPRKFSQIIGDRESGLIPRFIEEELTLLFWKRGDGQQITGCVLNDEELKARLLGRLSAIFTPTRILTLLDENGRPLITPDEDVQRDWRRPFAAREISALLPRWEAAVYLSDPGAVTARAQLTRMFLWILIGFFFLSIIFAGTYILQTLRTEMNLARQKTTFVANVSHELKTPLTSIRMFAEMLKEGRQPDPARRLKYLNLMVAETERLTRLINNVLDFSKMEKGKKQYNKARLDAALLVRNLLESQRVHFEHNGFTIGVSGSAGQAFIEGDEEALKQALLNLLSNAEKYSGERRDISVDIEVSGETVLILVKDRGPGIPPGDAKKIFKEFYRGDDSLTARVKGSGLGLSIAQKIITDHGGNIQYFSRDGGGSIFQIRLPRRQ
ncbi:MAG: HAMP domain-containing histidine kinase [Candidatus Aminicenantes bacterium]|nr:HAMP domain-containing histidine kinase [Candidatus Aminicenantes bacterium]